MITHTKKKGMYSESPNWYSSKITSLLNDEIANVFLKKPNRSKSNRYRFPHILSRNAYIGIALFAIFLKNRPLSHEPNFVFVTSSLPLSLPLCLPPRTLPLTTYDMVTACRQKRSSILSNRGVTLRYLHLPRKVTWNFSLDFYLKWKH